MRAASAVGFVALLGFGCTGRVDGPATEGLWLAEDDSRSLVGGFVTDTTALRFDAERLAPMRAELHVELQDGHVLEVVLDAEGSMSTDGGGATLEARDRDALAGLAEAIGERLPEDEIPALHEYLLQRMADYWSQAPEGWTLPTLEMAIPPATGLMEREGLAIEAVGDSGIRCVNLYSGYLAEWDLDRVNNSTTSGYSSRSIAGGACYGIGSAGHRADDSYGNYNCMGRCGGGCGSVGYSAYTRDCLDHDACSYFQSASGGTGHSQCGDEYDEAQDDWTWGTWWWHGCARAHEGMDCWNRSYADRPAGT